MSSSSSSQFFRNVMLSSAKHILILKSVILCFPLFGSRHENELGMFHHSSLTIAKKIESEFSATSVHARAKCQYLEESVSERERKVDLPFSINDANSRSIESHPLVDFLTTLLIFMLHFTLKTTN